MSLKGYQWLINDEVVMSYTFKYRELDIWKDVTLEEYHKFIDYIRSKGEEPHTTNQNDHRIIGLN